MLSYFCLFATSILIQPNQEKSFLCWMRNNNKFYTGDEYHFRLGIYLSNSQFVQRHNKAHKSFRISLNKFATYTPTEYNALLGEKRSLTKLPVTNYNQKRNWPTPPEQLDWRDKGAVNGIVNQGSCGSCWAFSSISAAESCWFLSKGELLKYSEQNIIDCVTKCEGCGGGLRDDAYNYVIENQGGQFNLESDYPYENEDGFPCRFNKDKAVGGIKGYLSPKSKDEEDLLSHVAHYGPVTVGIDASGLKFIMYASGIYDDPDDCMTDNINHGVVCIGYGEEEGRKYWIIRNSYGTEWGENGYVRMLRGINLCDVATRVYAVYYDIE